MNILIVDDNFDNRMTIELLLESFDDVVITHAENGEEALQKCRQNSFDLIFMDIMMPVMDGIEATRRIKPIASGSMIIALSALDDEVSKHAMLEAGAEDYMTKPIDSDLFKQRVRNYLSILSMRSQYARKSEHITHFNEELYPSTLTFNIEDEAALAYFWSYLLNRADYKAEHISDVVRIVYGFGLWMLKLRHPFSIVVEESDTYLFLTQLELDAISEGIIKRILLRHYNEAVYIVKNATLSFKLKKSEGEVEAPPSAISEEEVSYTQQILSKTHFNKTTAAEFVEATAISYMNKIEDLEQIEDQLDQSLIAFEDTPSHDAMMAIGGHFTAYTEVVELLVEFEHLTFALKSMAEFLEGVAEENFDTDRVKKFVTLTLHLLEDLQNWRHNIFIKQEANDIHYLDSSLLSSCLQIEGIFGTTAVEEEEGDLEFF
jgi:two-component system chemotaxis response regulator CheY